jgi:hypothetical protein
VPFGVGELVGLPPQLPNLLGHPLVFAQLAKVGELSGVEQHRVGQLDQAAGGNGTSSLRGDDRVAARVGEPADGLPDLWGVSPEQAPGQPPSDRVPYIAVGEVLAVPPAAISEQRIEPVPDRGDGGLDP